MLFKLPAATIIVAATGLAAASPLLTERQSTVTPPDNYYLQTKVVGDLQDSGTNKDGLYLYSYHTGAGLGDGCLSSNKSIGLKGYLNGTQQLFHYGTNTEYPWPLNVLNGFYQQWQVTTISIAGGPGPNAPGFFFNSSGLQYNFTESAGWLACDWWHGVPQLFNTVDFTYGRFSSSCSKVELYPVAV